MLTHGGSEGHVNMRYIVQLSLLGLVAAGSTFAQPTLGAVVSAASYASAPKDASGNPIGNNVIAQGSIFVAFGSGIGPAAIAYAGLPLPTSLPDANGTSIAVSSGGQKVNAFMVYTSAGQVAAILPSNTPLGPANVTVTYNGKTSAPVVITVAKSSLGMFTANAQGTGPAAAQHGGDSSPILLTKAAQPGEVVVLYGTGLGPIAGADNVPPGAVQVGAVTVTVAGKVVTPGYAGRSPSFAGLDQINFTIPSDVATGCYVPASVTASGQVSQDFVLPIASAGATACTHPLGLSQSALATLDAGGTVNAGLFLLLRAFVAQLNGPIEGAGGLFANVNANGVFQMYNRISVAFGSVSYPAPLNGCVVVDQLNIGGGFTVPDFSLIGGKELVADSLLMNLNGPGGATGQVLRQDTGGYLGVFGGFSPAILGPGSWTLVSTGGVDVGAFNASITLPSNLNFTNSGNLATPPRGDLNIVWTGGIAAGNPVVTVFGNSTVVNAKDPSKTRGQSFYCAAPAAAGKFLVPASVTQKLSSSVTADGETAFGSLGIATGGAASFTAPLTKGTLDVGSIQFGEAIVISVKYGQ